MSSCFTAPACKRCGAPKRGRPTDADRQAVVQPDLFASARPVDAPAPYVCDGCLAAAWLLDGPTPGWEEADPQPHMALALTSHRAAPGAALDRYTFSYGKHARDRMHVTDRLPRLNDRLLKWAELLDRMIETTDMQVDFALSQLQKVRAENAGETVTQTRYDLSRLDTVRQRAKARRAGKWGPVPEHDEWGAPMAFVEYRGEE